MKMNRDETFSSVFVRFRHVVFRCQEAIANQRLQGCGLGFVPPIVGDVLTSIHHRTELDFGWFRKVLCFGSFRSGSFKTLYSIQKSQFFSGIGFDPYLVVLCSLIGYWDTGVFHTSWLSHVVTTTGATRARTKTNTTNERSQENIHDAGFNRIYFRLWKVCLVSWVHTLHYISIIFSHLLHHSISHPAEDWVLEWSHGRWWRVPSNSTRPACLTYCAVIENIPRGFIQLMILWQV